MIRASGDRGTATAPLTLTDSGGSEDGGSSLLPAALLESAAGTLLFSLGVGLVVLLAASLAFNSVRGERLRRRLSPHLGDHRARLAAAERGRFAFLAGVFRATEGVFAHWRHWLALQSLLERAAIPLRTVEFVYVMVGCGLAAGILTALIFGSSAVGFLGLVGGAAAPLGFVLFKAKQRVRAFEDQLPDLLVGLAASLKAGHSFRHALQTVADEGRPPASLELNRVLTEARLGRPMEEALSEMAARVGSSNFDFVITSVNIQRQVGGSLAGLIDMVADTVRQRQQFERKIKGLTAMGRASAYVLMVLPFFMAGAITLINPGYMDPLFNTATGHKLILIGLLMMTFGCIAMRRIVSFRG
jgi:tight adherence protein B